MEKKDNYQLYYLIIAAGGLALTGYGVYRNIQQDKERQPPKRLLRPGESFLLVGDSIGVGLQTPLAKRSEEYGSYMDSMVKIGTTVSYWSNIIDERDAGFDLILLSLGSNDVVGDPTSESSAMDRLIATLSMRGAPIYWIVPPSFRLEHFTPKQEIFANMLADRGVFPLPIDGPQPSVASDPAKLHLTPEGYRTYAAQIFESITTPR